MVCETILCVHCGSDRLRQDNSGLYAGDSTWNVLYNRQYQGIPYKDDFAVIMIDAETNQLIDLGLTYRGVPPDNAGSAATVTQSQAQAVAQNQINTPSIQGVVFQNAIQEIVLPNTYWQDGGSNFTPGQSKVAWVVNFSTNDPSNSEPVF